MIRFRTIKPDEISDEESLFWNQAARTIEPLNNPLLSPEYCQQIFKTRNDVEIGIVENAQELIGILPFHRKSNGQGRPIGDQITDAHCILTSDFSIGVRNWVKGFHLNSFNFDHLLGDIPERFVFRRDPCYRMNLQDGHQAYVEQTLQSSNIVRELRRKKRKLQREIGEVDFHWQMDSRKCIDDLLRWKLPRLSPNQKKTLHSPWVSELACNLIDSSSLSCRGVLSGLKVNGELVALHLGIASQSFLASWIPSSNPLFDKYSVGGILYLELAKYAAESGIQCIDLGRGENQTKVRLANDAISMAIGSVCKSPLRQWAMYRLDAGKQRFKKSRIFRALTHPH